jgi:phosphate/sulfate permease
MAITASAAASGLPDSSQRGLVGASFGAGVAVEVPLTRFGKRCTDRDGRHRVH